MLSIIPEETKVILIGISDFPKDPDGLPKLPPSIKYNLLGLEQLIINPAIIGVPSQGISKLYNEKNASTIIEKIAEESSKANDTIFIYYAGHGLIGNNTLEFYLAAGNSSVEMSEFNAIPFKTIGQAINCTNARKKILILDCCFSGRATSPFMSSKSMLLDNKLDIEGTYIIASAGQNELAIAPPNDKYTAFTGELINVLHEGIDNGKKVITLQEVYDQIRLNLQKRRSYLPDLPEPRRANFQDADKLVIAHNSKGKHIIKHNDVIIKQKLNYDIHKNKDSKHIYQSSLKKILSYLKNVRKILDLGINITSEQFNSAYPLINKVLDLLQEQILLSHDKGSYSLSIILSKVSDEMSVVRREIRGVANKPQIDYDKLESISQRLRIMYNTLLNIIKD